MPLTCFCGAKVILFSETTKGFSKKKIIPAEIGRDFRFYSIMTPTLIIKMEHKDTKIIGEPA